MAARRAVGRQRLSAAPARWARRAHTVSPRLPAGRRAATALLVVAVAVQVLVWGRSPVSGGGGALLPALRPVAGVPYAVVVVVLELLLCAWLGLRQGAVLVLVTAAAVDVGFWAFRLGGLHVPSGAAASITAAFGALALAAGLLSGRLGSTNRR